MNSATNPIPAVLENPAPQTTHPDRSFALASDPATSPDILVAFSRAPDEQIGYAVARNPNTPLDTLFPLWESFPQAYLENPLRDYWALTQSEPSPKDWPEGVRWSIYRHLIRNGHLRDLATFMGEREREDLASGYPARGAFLGRPQFLLMDPCETVRLRVLQKDYRYVTGKSEALEKVPRETYLKVASDPSARVREALAEHPSTPSAARLVLARDPEPSVRLTLAKHSVFERGDKDMAAVWDLLSRDEDPEVKIAICRRGEADFRLIARLADDAETTVRCAAARSHVIDGATIGKLANDPETDVQVAVASNEKASPPLLDELARRHVAPLQEAILANASAEIETLEYILREGPLPDQSSILRNRRFRSKIVDRLWELLDVPVRSALASQSGHPAAVLLRLAEDPALKVRLALTHRLLDNSFQHDTETNCELVDTLSRDPSPWVRKQILYDVRIANERLVEMVRDPSPKVRSALGKRWTRIPPQARVALCRDTFASVRHSAAEKILNKLESFRQYCSYDAYRNLYTEARNALTKLASDPSREIRALLAGQSETPPAALDILLFSGDPEISKTVSERKRFPYGAILDFTLDRSWPRKRKAPRTATACTPSVVALETYAQRKNGFLRLLTARYHRTRISTLRRLVKDRDPRVQAAAQANLERKVKP